MRQYTDQRGAVPMPASGQVGWQSTRFLTDRAEAERAIALAEQLGSVNAAAAEPGTTWPSPAQSLHPPWAGHAGPQPRGGASPLYRPWIRCLWRSTWAPSPARERLAAIRRADRARQPTSNRRERGERRQVNRTSRTDRSWRRHGSAPPAAAILAPPWLPRRMAACMCRDPAQHRYNDEAPICDRASTDRVHTRRTISKRRCRLHRWLYGYLSKGARDFPYVVTRLIPYPSSPSSLVEVDPARCITQDLLAGQRENEVTASPLLPE